MIKKGTEFVAASSKNRISDTCTKAQPTLRGLTGGKVFLFSPQRDLVSDYHSLNGHSTTGLRSPSFAEERKLNQSMLPGDKNMDSEWQRQKIKPPTNYQHLACRRRRGHQLCNRCQKIHSLSQSNVKKKTASISISSLDLKRQYIWGIYISHHTLDKDQLRTSLPLHKSNMESVQHLHGKWTKQKLQFYQDSFSDGMRKIFV